jgi:hypothetical protein
MRDGLLYRQSSSGDRLCIPAAGELLQELHATPLGGNFGRDKTTARSTLSVVARHAQCHH